MSSNTIALVIFFGSSLGIGSILIRKFPSLADLSEPDPLKEELNSAVADKKKPKLPSGFSFDSFLEKLLKRVRILSLKTDRKTFSWLQKIKENNQKKKIEQDENYWDEVKKATKK